MAGVRKIDQAEWDKQDSASCPKLVKRQAWMHGDIAKPLPSFRAKGATRKVSAHERAVYAACESAMASGAIHSWSIDDKAGRWLVKVTEDAEWLELDMAEVSELVGTAPAVKVAKVRTVKAVAAPAVVSVPEVTETQIRALPAEVEEYLARLVYAAKRDYAAALASFMVGDGPAPADPGTDWSVKVQAKLAKLVKA